MSSKFGLRHKILREMEKSIIAYRERRIALKPEHAKVEFYLMDAFEIFHFLPIYNALKQDGIETNFVCEPPEINTVRRWFDYENAIKILENLNLKYTQKADCYSRISFTTQDPKVLSKYYGLKINLNYGCGFNKTNFGNTPASSIGFDYKFVHGKYMAKNAEKSLKKSQVKIIGYPKHDDFLKNLPQKCDILNKLGIKTEKPVLVYFPTWDEDASIQKFGEAIKMLREDFYVVTKAHHCTFRLEEKKYDLETLYKISDMVLEGNSNFSDSVIIADIALIDGKSGSSCEVPYLKPDLPVVYLSPRENLEEFYQKEIYGFGEFINSPDKLGKTVKKVYENDAYVPVRIKNVEYYLGKRDGNSTQRAINEI